MRRIKRLSDADGQAGAIGLLAACWSDALVTAVSDADNRLTLVGWQAKADKIERTGDSGKAAGRIGRLAMASLDDDLLATASCGDDDRLSVLAWGDLASEQPQRLADSGKPEYEASSLCATAIEKNADINLVTSFKDDESRVRLLGWQVGKKAVRQVADSRQQTGAVGEVAAPASISAGQMVTAVRTADDRLDLLSWRLDDGQIERVGDADKAAGAADRIKITALASDPSILVTAMRNDGGSLSLLAWRLGSDGRIERGGENNMRSLEVEELAIATVADRVVVAVRAGDNRLRVVSFVIEDGGDKITAIGDSEDQAGRVDALSLVVAGELAMTPVRDANGKLNMLGWDIAD